MRCCPHCHVTKPFSDFQFTKYCTYSGWCRKCRSAKEAERRRSKDISIRKRSVIADGTKLCTHCEKFLPLDNFSPSERSLGGLCSYCRPCQKLRYYDKEKARQATMRYRQRNRAWHLTLHRLRMYERNTQKRVVDDGTVTPSFMRSLYAETHCAYCFLPVPKKNRTADHRVALASGGTHSAGNLVMACFTCNSSKRQMSETEFRKRLFTPELFEKYLDYYLPKRKH